MSIVISFRPVSVLNQRVVRRLTVYLVTERSIVGFFIPSYLKYDVGSLNMKKVRVNTLAKKNKPQIGSWILQYKIIIQFLCCLFLLLTIVDSFLMANTIYILFRVEEKKKDIWLSPMKKPYTSRKFITTRQHKNATKNFHYTTISDRLKTVSSSKNSHPTGVVKPVYGYASFPLIAKAV